MWSDNDKRLLLGHGQSPESGMELGMREKSVSFRLYEELNEYVPNWKRKRSFRYRFTGNPTVGELVDTLGVPVCEVELILVNGQPVDSTYRVCDGDRVSVYPVFESFDVSSVKRPRSEPLRELTFVTDNDLRELAEELRKLGYKTRSCRVGDEKRIDAGFAEQKPVVLTRNAAILEDPHVTRGYVVKSNIPKEQLEEVVERFQLV